MKKMDEPEEVNVLMMYMQEFDSLAKAIKNIGLLWYSKKYEGKEIPEDCITYEEAGSMILRILFNDGLKFPLSQKFDKFHE